MDDALGSAAAIGSFFSTVCMRRCIFCSLCKRDVFRFLRMEYWTLDGERVIHYACIGRSNEVIIRIYNIYIYIGKYLIGSCHILLGLKERVCIRSEFNVAFR